MLKYIFYCLVQYGLIAEGILGVTRLQSVLGGRDLLIKRHVLRRTILEDDLEFIDMTKANGGKFALPLFDINQLGRTGNPVDAFRKGMCAVGLDADIETGFVQRSSHHFFQNRCRRTSNAGYTLRNARRRQAFRCNGLRLAANRKSR